MKKIISIIALVLCTLAVSAQKDVTKFLGVPVDGTKSEMKKKLIAKGFTPKVVGGQEYLKGEFNGNNVEIVIGTNNNRVYRIMVLDAGSYDEADIKIRFNNLVRQFEKNKRYITLKDYTLSEVEDISYEMAAHSKVYEAEYFQRPVKENYSIDELEKKHVWFRISQYLGKYKIALYYDNEYNHADGEDL